MLYALFWVIPQAFEFFMPTFRNTLFHPSMKMEQAGCSETSEYKIKTPGELPRRKHTIEYLYYLLNISYMFRRSLCHRQEEPFINSPNLLLILWLLQWLSCTALHIYIYIACGFLQSCFTVIKTILSHGYGLFFLLLLKTVVYNIFTLTVQNSHFLYRFVVLWQYMFLLCSIFLPEDGTLSAETCRRHLVNNTNIQLYMSVWGHPVALLFAALRYKPKRRGCHWKISLTQSFRPHYGDGVDSSAYDRNEYKEYFLGGKGGRCVGLTNLPPSFVDCHEIWEPQPTGTLSACPRLYRDFLPLYTG